MLERETGPTGYDETSGNTLKHGYDCLITQRSQVQILPPLQRKWPLTCGNADQGPLGYEAVSLA